MEHAENLRLQELDEFKNRFFTNISHELRTPLTVIIGMANQLNEEAEEQTEEGVRNFSSKVKDRCRLILRNAASLLSLVNQMLDLSKLENGKLTANWEHGDAIVFLQYLSESFHSFAATKNINLTFYPEVSVLEMDFDREKLQHIVYNLLSNAIKNTPNGGKVFVHASQVFSDPIQQANASAASFLQIKITDTGEGIPSTHLPKIFDRFYRVSESGTGTEGGTGIGLALTKELVELLGGSISVRSEMGKGSQFTVLLPILHNAVASPASKNLPQFAVAEFEPISHASLKPELPLSQASDNDLPLLLIIEDNVDVADYLRSCFEPKYSVLLAEDGQSGMDKALETVPDIIVSDVMMPKKDGFEVMEFLKNDERTSHIPIVLLTAKADYHSRIEGLERGAEAYLAKPFDKKELQVTVEKLVELRRKLQARYAHFGFQTPDFGGKEGVPQLSDIPAYRTGRRNPASLPTGQAGEIAIEDAFMKKVNAVIEKHLSDAGFEVVHLCRAIRLSQPQLYRKIKALTGKSIVAYIRTYRLQKGRELLLSSGKTISEVAYEVGFTDPSYFSRMFSEEFGLAPNELRK